MAIPMDQITSMPAFSPYYPPPPVRYRNARFQFVFFRADPAAVDRVLPACLEPAEDGYCVAIGITVPWASSYGAFDESVLTVKCTFKGETGFFAPVAFLNSRSSIPAGREIYGTPKVFAEFECGMDERVAFTDTRLAGASVLAIRSTFHRAARVEELPDLTPSWRLKAIPRVDGRGRRRASTDRWRQGDLRRRRAHLPGGGRSDPVRPLAYLQPGRLHAAGVLRRLLSGAGLHRGVRGGGARLPESRLKPDRFHARFEEFEVRPDPPEPFG